METTYTIFDHDGHFSSVRMTELLRFLSPWCDELVLVVRAETMLEPPGLELLDAMSPSLRSVTRSKVWPGTKSGQPATIHSFDLNDFVLSHLSRTGNGLFGWQHPDWPEDPCLLSEGVRSWPRSPTTRHAFFSCLRNKKSGSSPWGRFGVTFSIERALLSLD